MSKIATRKQAAAKQVVATPADAGTIDRNALDRAAARAARYPAAAANEARRAAHIANSTEGGKAVAKAAASAKAAEDTAHAALVTKAAGLVLEGTTVTERLWSLFNQLGTPGTFPRRVAAQAALEHGLNPSSAGLAFIRWTKTPSTPRSK